MKVVIEGFAQFMPYVFMLGVVGVIRDQVYSAFRGWM